VREELRKDVTDAHEVKYPRDDFGLLVLLGRIDLSFWR
jgi:hypothetical protein